VADSVQNGSVQAGSVRDERSVRDDSALDDCWAAQSPGDHCVPVALLDGCLVPRDSARADWARAGLVRDERSVQGDSVRHGWVRADCWAEQMAAGHCAPVAVRAGYLVLLGSAPADWSRAGSVPVERWVPDDCWAEQNLVDHCVPVVQPGDCSAEGYWAAPDSVPADCSAPMDCSPDELPGVHLPLEEFPGGLPVGLPVRSLDDFHAPLSASQAFPVGLPSLGVELAPHSPELDAEALVLPEAVRGAPPVPVAAPRREPVAVEVLSSRSLVASQRFAEVRPRDWRCLRGHRARCSMLARPRDAVLYELNSIPPRSPPQRSETQAARSQMLAVEPR